MLGILLDHTEIYYTGSNIINYNVYVVNALTIFFILSGYLMYKDNPTFNIKHKLKSIFKSLLIPYFIFTTIIAVPKALAHGNTIEWINICMDIIMGQASWFVAALCLSELIFALSVENSHYCFLLESSDSVFPSIYHIRTKPIHGNSTIVFKPYYFSV
jgi:fucose 4-O-acetylase-like acetyltransferase